MAFNQDAAMEVETTAPLEIEHIQNLYSNRDKIRFIIDYKESALKDQGLLFYMSNLELPGDIAVKPDVPLEEKFSLLKAYMELNNLIELPTLLLAIMLVLFRVKNIDITGMVNNPLLTPEEIDQFVLENIDLVGRWAHVMDSMYAYTLFVVAAGDMAKKLDDPSQDVLQGLVEQNPIYQQVPHVEDMNYVGMNFPYVFAIPRFQEIYYGRTKADISTQRFFTHQFTEYCFRGENLYKLYMESDCWLLAAVMVLSGRGTPKEDTTVEEVSDN